MIICFDADDISQWFNGNLTFFVFLCWFEFFCILIMIWHFCILMVIQKKYSAGDSEEKGGGRWLQPPLQHLHCICPLFGTFFLAHPLPFFNFLAPFLAHPYLFCTFFGTPSAFFQLLAPVFGTPSAFFHPFHLFFSTHSIAHPLPFFHTHFVGTDFFGHPLLLIFLHIQSSFLQKHFQNYFLQYNLFLQYMLFCRNNSHPPRRYTHLGHHIFTASSQQ